MAVSDNEKGPRQLSLTEEILVLNAGNSCGTRGNKCDARSEVCERRQRYALRADIGGVDLGAVDEGCSVDE